LSKHLLIIGAGIAGLAAGIYAQRSGLNVTILEQHTLPGGMCTSWRRKGYLFEGALHWLTGSSPQNPLHTLWREVGALDDTVKLYYDDPYRSVQHEGQRIFLYRDLQKLQKHFDDISPEDAATTKGLIRDIRRYTRVAMPISDMRGVSVVGPRRSSLGTILKMMPSLPLMARANRLTVTDYLSHFKHPGIQLVLGTLVPEDYSAASLLFSLATMASGDGGYPQGGSLAFAKRMADTFTAMGGEIRYQTKVHGIVRENGKAVGVRIRDKILNAPALIVTAETLAAEKLLDFPITDPWFLKLKERAKPTNCCFIGIGLQTLIKEIPGFVLDEPIAIGPHVYRSLGFHCYTQNPTYAPEGCTAVTTTLMGDSYDYWKTAKAQGRYQAEKQRLADEVLGALCRHAPQIEGHIEVVDIATPLTYESYTGATRGAWMSTLDVGQSIPSCPCTLKNVQSLYFAGHRTLLPGGLPSALVSGRRAAQMVCRQFGIPFQSKQNK